MRPTGILAGGPGAPAGKTWGTADYDISESKYQNWPGLGALPDARQGSHTVSMGVKYRRSPSFDPELF